MKKNMHKDLGRKKTVVLGIALVFVLGAFTPAIGSQNVKIVSNQSSEKSEKIDNGAEESVDSTDAIDSDTIQQEELLSSPGSSPLDAGASWWNTNWQYRKEITINHSKVDVSLINFPVLISLNSDTDLANNGQDDGYDIVFTADNDNQLHHEIEYFDGSTGELVCWVNVTSVSSTEDTTIYIYYGNPSCGSQQIPSGVWDSNFVMVQHLNETSGTHYDSTSYGNDGSPQGTLNQNAVGKFDGADEFDGVDDYVNFGNDPSLSISDVLSVEAWVNFTDTGSSLWRGVVTKNDYHDWAFAVGGTHSPGKAVIYISGAAGDSSGNVISTSAINDGIWHHIVATYDGSTTRMYVDGIEETNSTTLTGAIHTSTLDLLIGDYETLPRLFDGGIDEVRVSNTVRNADWIKTEYNNQHDPSTFYSVGSEEIANMKPTANFTYTPKNPYVNDVIQFNDTSTDSDGTIVSWLWDFDDSNTSTEQNPTHQYTNNGTYNVSLTVTDDNAATDESSKEITVNVPPSANFTYTPKNPSTQDTIQFTDTSTDPDGTIVSWLWDFDDSNTSTEQNPTHQYTNNGTYNVSLTVTDDNAATDETSKEITVNVPPSANFTYTPKNPYVNDLVQFTDTSIDLDGTIVNWTWNFGDGTTNSTKQNPTHTYNKTGIYTVILTVRDNDDAIDTTSKEIEIVSDTISPIVNIIKPKKALYVLNFKIRSFLIRKPFIIGRIDIEVDASDNESGINYVEFYIDGKLKANITTPPYTYMWKRDRIRIFGHRHTIKVVAFDNARNSANEEIKVWKFL